MKDLADKISDDDKKALDPAVSAVRANMGGGDTAALKQETEALKNKSSEVFSKVYQQAGPDANAGAGAGQAGPDMGGQQAAGGQAQGGQDDVVDADYEVVDDEK